MNIVYSLGNGWYSFEDLPQGYMKVHGLLCGTQAKAVRFARKILKDNKAQITIKESR